MPPSETAKEIEWNGGKLFIHKDSIVFVPNEPMDPNDNELVEVDWFNGSKIKMHPGSIIFAPEEKDSN